MPDNTIDTLDIKIISDANRAIQSLDSLIGTLQKVEKGIGGIGKINLGGFTGSMKQLSAATNKLDVGKVTRFSGALDSLKNSIAGFGTAGKQLEKAAAGLEKIGNLDFGKFANLGDLSGFSVIAGGISNFADAAKKLAEVKPTEINRVIKDIEKLGKINIENLQQIATNFSAFSTAINGIPDLSRLADIGTAFQSFSTALSGADKASAGTTKLFTGLSQLAASANGVSVATQTLPALSDEIKKFLTVMAEASLVDSGTTSIVSSLSGIAGAGGRAAKAAAALPALTQGISNFVTAMSRMPSLNSNVVGVVQALNQFIKALAEADKVSTGTTKIFNSLSQLAASANNIPIVTQTLPALSAEVGRFVSTMSEAPVVNAGTVSLLTALSGIAGAGGRAAKAAAALPALTQGISNFVTAMSRMPTLNNNVVSVIQALAQFSAAGGRAGSAAQRLQGNIDGLSRSMSGLHGGVGKAATGLKSFVRNVAAVAGVSYGFYAVGNAIRSSINTASQLTEVQNVIDVTFGDMRGQLEAFADTSIQTLGMSELTAKKMAGRFQAMGLALGEAQQPMANMSIELTQLAGDMASFYDSSQEVVGQDLEAIFTGQTKPLRKYGIDLTQATLQSWALSKGINANFKSMSQLEKVQLRYAYVMEQSAYAQGDFSRTSGTWANQTRILGQQFQQLGSIIGSGLIVVFLPVVKVINVVISKVIQLANVIGSFLGKLFGFSKETQASGAGLASVADSTDSIVDGANSAADSLGGVGKAAKKAGEEAKGGLQSFDELNSISLNKGADSGGGGGASGASMPDMAFPTGYDFSVNAEDKASPILDIIVNRFSQLKNLFAAGFKIGLGDISVFDSIRKNFESIGESFKEIFTDSGVTSAFNGLLDTFAYNAGQKVGAFTSVGATIIDNITGGAALYLESAKERIKQYLIDMFNIMGETDTIVTNFTTALADIFTVFRSDTAKQITEDIIQIFSDGFIGVSELAAKFGRDVLNVILGPITENSEGFKEAIGNTLKPIETVLGTIADGFTETFGRMNQMYDEHLKPLFDSIKDGLSEVFGTLLDGYNTYIAPVLDGLAERFSEVWDSTIQPILNNFIDLFGSVADLVKTIWENILQPVINWIADKVAPLVAPVLDALGRGFMDTFEQIGKIFDGFLEAAKGVVDFLTGVFSGDWDKAWKGVKDVFKGIWDSMPDFVKGPLRSIIGFVNKMIKGIETGINAVINGLNRISIDIPATPFTDAFTLGFDLNTIELKTIPELANGMVVPPNMKKFLAILGDNNHETEVVSPLSTIKTAVADTIMSMNYEPAYDMPNYQINYHVPTVEAPAYSGMTGAFAKSYDDGVEAYAEIRRQNELLEEQNYLLQRLVEKPVIDKNDVGGAYISYAKDYRKQTGKQLGISY